MKQQTKSTPKTEVNEATVNFIKNVCMRITEALEEISTTCTEEPEEKSKASSLGHSQGIGLFLYVKQSQQALKTRFPAFTQTQIMNILIAQWQNLSQPEKTQFYKKFNVNQFRGSKKLKKLDKMAQKFSNSLQKQVNSSQQKKKIELTSENQINTTEKMDKNTKYIEKVEVLQQILQEQDCDHFFDEPYYQKPPIPNENQPCKVKNIKLSCHSTINISIEPKSEDKVVNQNMNLEQLLQTQEQITQNQAQKLSQIPIIQSQPHQEEEKQIQDKLDDKNLQILTQKQQNQPSDVDVSNVAVASHTSNEISSILSNSIIGKQEISRQSEKSKENHQLSSLLEQSGEQSMTLGPKKKEMDQMKCFQDNASASSNDLSQKSCELNSKNDNQSETPFFQAVSQAEEHLECQKLS